MFVLDEVVGVLVVFNGLVEWLPEKQALLYFSDGAVLLDLFLRDRRYWWF